MIAEGHIRRVEKVSDEFFHSICGNYCQKGQKTQSSTRCQISEECHLEEKYQIPNLDKLLEQVADTISANEEGTVMFTLLDMLYAYRQTELHPDTGKPCNFQIFGRRAT